MDEAWKYLAGGLLAPLFWLFIQWLARKIQAGLTRLRG